MSQQNTKTPAMVLQEFTVKHGYPPPEYNLVHSRIGTHENEFHYQVNVANIIGTGFGRSKQVAKHSAASKALELLAEMQLYDPRSDPVQEFDVQSHRNETGSPFNAPINFIGNLKDICCENKFPQPIFTEISDVGPPHCRQFTYQCKLGSLITQSVANTKKQAKQLAAKNMLDKVKANFPELVEELAAAANAITNNDLVMDRYNALNLDVIENKSVLIGDITLTIKKIMNENQLKIEDFSEYLKNPCDESIRKICEMLNVNYKIDLFQEEPWIVFFQMGIETTFSLLALGLNKEDAFHKLFVNICSNLQIYMSIDA